MTTNNDNFADFLRRRLFSWMHLQGEQGQLPSRATQKKFSRLTGISEPTVSRLLDPDADRLPGVRTVARLVQAPEVGAATLTELGILPDDPRIVEILNAWLRGDLTREQIENMAIIARTMAPKEVVEQRVAHAQP